METPGQYSAMSVLLVDGRAELLGWLSAVSRLINPQLQTFTEYLLSVGHSFRPFLHFRLWKITASPGHLSNPWQVPICLRQF